jgi:hypothetical protein
MFPGIKFCRAYCPVVPFPDCPAERQILVLADIRDDPARAAARDARNAPEVGYGLAQMRKPDFQMIRAWSSQP